MRIAIPARRAPVWRVGVPGRPSGRYRQPFASWLRARRPRGSLRRAGWTEAGADQGAGAHDPGRDGTPGHIRFGTVRGTRNLPCHSVPLCGSAGKPERPWKARRQRLEGHFALIRNRPGAGRAASLPGPIQSNGNCLRISGPPHLSLPCTSFAECSIEAMSSASVPRTRNLRAASSTSFDRSSSRINILTYWSSLMSEPVIRRLRPLRTRDIVP